MRYGGKKEKKVLPFVHCVPTWYNSPGSRSCILYTPYIYLRFLPALPITSPIFHSEFYFYNDNWQSMKKFDAWAFLHFRISRELTPDLVCSQKRKYWIGTIGMTMRKKKHRQLESRKRFFARAIRANLTTIIIRALGRLWNSWKLVKKNLGRPAAWYERLDADIIC